MWPTSWILLLCPLGLWLQGRPGREVLGATAGQPEASCQEERPTEAPACCWQERHLAPRPQRLVRWMQLVCGVEGGAVSSKLNSSFLRVRCLGVTTPLCRAAEAGVGRGRECECSMEHVCGCVQTAAVDKSLAVGGTVVRPRGARLGSKGVQGTTRTGAKSGEEAGYREKERTVCQALCQDAFPVCIRLILPTRHVAGVTRTPFHRCGA